MISVNSSDNGGSRGLINLLSRGDEFQQGSKEDTIGFQEAEGIEIWQNKTTKRYSLLRHDLNAADRAAQWLSTSGPGPSESSEAPCAKILMGDQVLSNDRLHPPEDAGAAQFSQRMLQNNFRLPAKAVSSVATNSKWQMKFSQYTGGPSRTCEGLGTSNHSFVMSKDQGDSCLFVFLVWHRAGQRDSRQMMIDHLKCLSDRRLDASLFAYIVSSVVIAHDVMVINHISAEIGKTDLDLRRFATQREADSLFGSAHSSANCLDGIEQDLKLTLKLVRMFSRGPKTKPSKNAFASQSDDVAQETALKFAFEHRIQELETTLQQLAYARSETARQLTTALNMMMYAQQHLTREDQKISIEIAEASKTIAEETKKDGSSMKTLAIVTMCFLPAATISSILSMSFFNWEAKSGEVVSGRLWVYFLLAVPLTLATLGVWWIWQRQLLRRLPPVAVDDKS